MVKLGKETQNDNNVKYILHDNNHISVPLEIFRVEPGNLIIA